MTNPGGLAPQPRPHQAQQLAVRVADSERFAVVDRLRGHLTAGRLDLTEFEDRTSTALAARTRGELAALLADLPELSPQGTGPPVRQREPRQPGALMGSTVFRLHTYLSVIISVFLVVIWAGTAIAAGPYFFWPVFPIAALGLTVGIHGAIRKALD